MFRVNRNVFRSPKLELKLINFWNDYTKHHFKVFRFIFTKIIIIFFTFIFTKKNIFWWFYFDTFYSSVRFERVLVRIGGNSGNVKLGSPKANLKQKVIIVAVSEIFKKSKSSKSYTVCTIFFAFSVTAFLWAKKLIR